MIEAIKMLGEYEIAKERLESIDQFIEKAKLKNTKKVICIVFRNDGESISYDHTHIEDYDSLNPEKYLYRSHQSRQFDVTPTTKIAYAPKNKKMEIEKAFDRVRYWFKKFVPLLKNKNQIEFLEQLSDAVSKNKDKILEDIFMKSEELKDDEKRNSILTIKIIDDGKEKYLEDFEVFKDILRREGLKFIYYRHGVEIKGEGICNLCGNKKEVCDYFPLKIYSMDKRGFAPEFIQKNAWKRLSVCFDCLPSLMVGGEFLNKYLLKSFYHGYKFYVIPNFILGKTEEDIIEEIKRQEKKEEYDGLLIEDDDILEPLKEREDVLNLIFMFCEFDQSIKVVKYVEDVPPSWIKRMNNTLQEINHLSIFKEETLKKVVGKKESGDLKDIDRKGTRVGGLVEAFFPKSKETGVYSKYFIDIIGDILAQRPINRDLLISAFMREIRNMHVKANKDKKYIWNEKVLALKSLMLLIFLTRLDLIKR